MIVAVTTWWAEMCMIMREWSSSQVMISTSMVVVQMPVGHV